MCIYSVSLVSSTTGFFLLAACSLFDFPPSPFLFGAVDGFVCETSGTFKLSLETTLFDVLLGFLFSQRLSALDRCY